MMRRGWISSVVAASLGAWAWGADAQALLVHMQGEPGSREAYYADFLTSLNRTPMDKLLGPVTVRQLDTTVVYEAPDKPEFSVLRLQFECTNRITLDGKPIPPPPQSAPVRVRVAEGSWKLRREDLNKEDLAVSEWRSAGSDVLKKLHAVACHDQELRSAAVKAAKKRSNDEAVAAFRQELQRLELPPDFMLMAARLPPEMLDFSWAVLWTGAPRPDPSGKWSRRPTAQERAEYKAKMDALYAQFERTATEMRGKLESEIKKMDSESAFRERAAQLRRGRSFSRSEQTMLSVWEGKPEREIAATLGAPIVSESGGLRFLSYGREFDNRVVVTNARGAAWQEGFAEHCNVQFVLLADQGLFRVADVRVWAGSTELGAPRFACAGVLEVPR